MTSLPAQLSNLTTREAIQDAIHRCVLGLDTSNADLFASAFTSDATLDLNGKITHGLSSIKTECYDPVSRLDTTHFVTNVRIDLTSNNKTAKMTASALAQHYRHGQGQLPDATRLLSGCLYDFDLVRDEETEGEGNAVPFWRITRWALKIVWVEGDWAVITAKDGE